MAGKSDYLENKILDHVLGATGYTPPTDLYFALFTAAPTDAGGGTEVTGGSYARVTVTNNPTNFPNASGGSKSNGAAITFAVASAAWGTIPAVAVFDDPTAGNMLYWANLVSPKTVGIGDQVSFDVGQVVFTED